MYAKVERALLAISPRPLDDLETEHVENYVNLADRSRRMRIDARDAERFLSTATRILLPRGSP